MPTSRVDDEAGGHIGRTFGERYRSDAFLARGGMGVVHRGTDLVEERPVAIKLLVESHDDPLSRRRFFNEAAMCASIDNANVVRILDFGVADDRKHCYIVMELLEGVSLAKYLKKRRRLPPLEALYIIEQVCEGLAAAHALGFVHRDLKPSNIMVVGGDDRGPRIKILDFGLAKRFAENIDLTTTGTFLGSPAYMSPEQIRGGSIGKPTDVYNAGLILYRMVTGIAPFYRSQVSAILAAHLTVPPPPYAEVAPEATPPAEVEWITTTCLQKPAEDRFASVGELLAAVRATRAWLSGESDELHITLKGRRIRGDRVSGVHEAVTHPSGEAVVPEARGPSDRTLMVVGVAFVGLGLGMMFVLGVITTLLITRGL